MVRSNNAEILQHIFNSINTHLKDVENSTEMLSLMAEDLNALRLWWFVIDHDHQQLILKTSFGGDEHKDLIESMQIIPLDFLPNFMARLETEGFFFCEDIDTLPEESEAEKELLKQVGSNSFMAGQVISPDNHKYLFLCEFEDIKHFETRDRDLFTCWAFILAPLFPKNIHTTENTTNSLIMENVTDNSTVKILLAEDNTIDQKLIIKMLKNLGFHSIDIANDGKEAVELLVTTHYDLILMDIQMPNLSGIETAKKIRESSINTPIIAISADATKSDMELCLKSGMNDYIVKPVKKTKFADAIDRWLYEAPGFFDEVSSQQLINQSEVVEISEALERIEDTDTYKLILKEFINDLPDHINSLVKYVEQKKHDDLAFLARKLKSSAANLSLITLARTFFDLETSASERSSNYYDLLMENITIQIQDINQTVEHIFQDDFSL